MNTEEWLAKLKKKTAVIKVDDRSFRRNGIEDVEGFFSADPHIEITCIGLILP